MGNTTYRLQNDGTIGFKKIMLGKKWVGRVCRHVEGYYLGVIGNGMVRAPTEVEALNAIVAKQGGVVVTRYPEGKRGSAPRFPKKPKYNQCEKRAEPPEHLETPDVITGLPQRKRVNPNSEAR